MTTHSFTPIRRFALGFVVLALVLLTTARVHGALALSDNYPKVPGQESGDYFGIALTDDQGAGSGIAWWPSPRNTYLILDNNGSRILEVDRTLPPVTALTLRRTIDLDGFGDAEDIHWIAGNTFFISQEKNSSSVDEIVVLTIPEGEDDIDVNITDTMDPAPKILRRLQFTLGQTVNNKGIEGCVLLNGMFYFTTEDPISGNWTVWKTRNDDADTGTINVEAAGPPDRTFAFSISAINTPPPARALDISGMATDGTFLWLLSHEGPFTGTAPGKGRVLKFTTAGKEIADYTLPALPSPHIWNQAEGIELFYDPADGLMKILLAGEKGDTAPNAGVDFMTLTSVPFTSDSLGTRLTLTAGDGPIQTVVADFNGDRKDDIAVANAYSSTISIYRNNTTVPGLNQNSLTLVDTLPAGSGAYMLTAADLDSDGKLDLITGNHPNASVSVFRNQSASGTFSFAAKQDFTTGLSALGVAAGDVDGDLKPDIVTANYTDGKASVLLNTSTPGSISFAAKEDFTSGPNPHSIALGDLNGDGKPEIVVGNNGNHTVSVLRNTSTMGDPNFAAAHIVSAGGTTVAVGDWDLDGKQDLVSGSWPQSSISLVRNTTVNLSSTLSFEPAVEVSTGGNTHTVALGHLDGDGKPDLAVVTEMESYLLIYRNLSTPGSISQASLSPAMVFDAGWNAVGVSVGDLDGDYRPEVVFANAYDDNIFIYRNFPGVFNSTSLGPRLDFTSVDGPIHTVIADLDGDGKRDVAVANFYTATVTVFKNSSAGTLDQNSLELVSTLPIGAFPSSVSGQFLVAADLNNDNKVDLITANHNANTVSVIRNNSSSGNFNFFAKLDFPVGSVAAGLAVRDIDGDLKPDIVTANWADNTATVLQNVSVPQGEIDFDFVGDFPAGLEPHSVALGDLDGDTKPEMIVGNNGEHTLTIYRNNSTSGTISFHPTTTTHSAGGKTIALGDLDNDGKSDLITGSWPNNSISLVRNVSTLGMISLETAVELGIGGFTHTIALALLDNDTKLDVIVVSEMDSKLMLFHNESVAGSFSFSTLATPATFATGWNAVGVSAGDLNADNRPDIVFANHYDDTITVYRNTIVP
jgi:hypothetical protein